jgi:uncharacterized protein
MMTAGNLALIILLATVVQVIVAILLNVRRRRRDAIEGNDTSRAALVPAEVSSSLDRDAWEGFKAFRVERRVIENEAGDICSFYLKPEEPFSLPDFKPGQFLTFKFNLPATETTDARTVTRCYSLSDQPCAERYRITVKRVDAPAGQAELAPGLASNYLHDRVHEGDQLMVKAPSGPFHLIEEPALPLVLIAGGIGITPMLSIINSLLEQKSEREIWLFYGVRNGLEVIMHKTLLVMAQNHPGFHLHLCYSRPTAEDQAGIDYQHAGHVDLPLLQSVLKLGRYHYYVCGPTAMMESIVPGLEALGVPKSDIHYEAFGPATLTKPKAVDKDNKPQTSWQIEFSKSGKSALWRDTEESLLGFVEAEGIDVDSGCRAGSCGGCQTRIESGEVDYAQEPVVDVEEGHCLLCISRPKSDLNLAL